MSNSSVELSKDGKLCLVDGNGHFGLNEAEFNNAVEIDENNINDEYSIIGIMGCQSTGKSTLLNHLFNTDFSMMNSELGRSQTTKGIWLDQARNVKNLLVMDLEGTDSGERGEDRTTFERQTILYGLSLCEVLIVNMWMTDIGRYTASNYGIMKTVFEVNLQIFRNQGKTQLLFIIRDFVPGTSPLETLIAKLRKDMENIWNELSKPEGLENADIYDFFDFKFEALPHYILQKTEFLAKVDELRNKFSNKEQEDSYLHTSYHGKKSVPISGFVQYCKDIWEVIESNQDLNLPSQRELLASFRCDEVAAQLLRTAEDSLTQVKTTTDKQFTKDLSTQVHAIYTDIITQYDKLTHKYAPSVVEAKKKELCLKLYNQIDRIISSHIQKFLIDNSVDEFSKQLKSKVQENVLCEELYLITSQAKSTCADGFTSKIVKLYGEVAAIAESLDIHFISTMMDRHLPQLEAKIDGVIESARKIQLQVLSHEYANKLQKNLSESCQELFKLANPDMWEQIGLLFASNVSKIALEIVDLLDKLANTDAERIHVMKYIIEQNENYLYDMSLQHARLVPLKMKGHFDQIFTREDGSKRVWGASHNVHKIFKEAKESALSLLVLFSQFCLREHWKNTGSLIELPAPSPSSTGAIDISGVDLDLDTSTTTSAATTTGVSSPTSTTIPPSTRPLLTEEQLETFKQEFLVDAEGQLHDAQQERERNMSQAKLPTWAIVLLLVLGWNEIQAIIMNPFFLVLAVILGLASIVVHSLGMWGPVLTMGKQFFNQAMSQVQVVMTALQEQNNTKEQQPTLQRSASTVGNSETMLKRAASSAPPANTIDLDNVPDVSDSEPMLTRRATAMQE